MSVDLKSGSQESLLLKDRIDSLELDLDLANAAIRNMGQELERLREQEREYGAADVNSPDSGLSGCGRTHREMVLYFAMKRGDLLPLSELAKRISAEGGWRCYFTDDPSDPGFLMARKGAK